RDRIDIIVEAPVAMLLLRIAPGDAEDLEALRQQEPDEALFRRQIERVVLVDLWRRDDDRPPPNLGGHGPKLDQLEPLVAIDDGAWRRSEVLAHLERAGVDLRRKAAVLDEIGDIVLQARPQALPAGVDDFLERRGVAEQSVGGRKGVDEDSGDEFRARAVVLVEINLLDVGRNRVGPGKIALQDFVMQRAGLP